MGVCGCGGYTKTHRFKMQKQWNKLLSLHCIGKTLRLTTKDFAMGREAGRNPRIVVHS